MAGGTQGRRGYYLYEYGSHLWFPQELSDFSGGMYRDVARDVIPKNGVYDSLDFFFDRPGVVYKRGGTTGVAGLGTPYFMSSVAAPTISYYCAIVHAFFPNVATQLIAISDQGEFINILNGLNQGIGPGVVTKDKPKVFIGGTKNFVVITDAAGVSKPYVWNGTDPPKLIGETSKTLTVTGTPTGGSLTLRGAHEDATSIAGIDTATIVFNASNSTAKTALDGMAHLGTFTVTGGALPGTPLVITADSTSDIIVAGANSLTGGTAPAFTLTTQSAAANCPAAFYSAIHLLRLVLANTIANPNRIFFSPLLDPNLAWDSTAYVDADHPITGLASLGSTLIVFSEGYTEKYTGSVPPPGTDFVHSYVGAVGCTDARSISTHEGGVIFANPTGVYSTAGVGFTNLMEGRIATYWRDTVMSGYVQSTWTITTGVLARRFLWVTVLNASRTLVGTLVCDLATGAWGRVSTPPAMMYATSVAGGGDLYASDGALGGPVSLASTLRPTAANKVDATSAAVTPSLELRPFGGGPGITAFGKGHITYDMRDAASDNPTLAVTTAAGIEAPTYAAVAESPLGETTDAARIRYSTGRARGSQALSVKFAQTNASSKTEIYVVEQDTRGFPREVGGQ